MKVKAKSITNDGNNRISALNRLSKPISNTTSVHQRISAPTTSMVTDARQLLTNRNKPIFDARQLLSRKTKNNSLVIQRDIEFDEEDEEEEEEEEVEEMEDNTPKTLVLQRSNNGRLIAGSLDRPLDKKKNPFISTEPISFIKTTSNTSNDRDSHNSTLADQKFVISFSNDQYRKRARSPSPSPIIKRLNNASIQTATTSSSSRLSNRRDSDELPKKQPGLLTTTSRSKSSSSTNLDAATILITNLQPSVTEDDVIELFGEIGQINDIKTLSRGCIQVIYSKEEYAKQAVTNYHNRLLDGQLMYVSLQQPSYSTKSSKTASSSSLSTNNESSNKYSIDASFIRQALFNSSTNTTNPVQFQVKL